MALVVLDGAADRPEEALGGGTPLSLARTPNLDRIARRSVGSMIQILPNGGAPQTHSGMLSLLGYPDVALTAKRGVLEASVVFGDSGEGRLYARGNLSSLVHGKIPSRRVNRDVFQDEADALCALLTRHLAPMTGLRCHIRSYSTYRLAIEIGPGDLPLSDRISSTDPGYSSNEYATPTAQADFSPVWSKALDDGEDARRTAEAVNAITRACHRIMDVSPINAGRRSQGRLPVNFVLMRDFGMSLPETPTFEQRWGLRAKYFHDLPVELGIANYLGMDEEAAGCAAVTPAAFADAGRRLLRDLDEYDFIAFHVKGPDEPGHDGNWEGKVRAIEAVDAGLFSLLAPEVETGGITLAVTSDHATCWAVGTHTSDLVPLIMTDPAADTHGLRLTERACAEAGGAIDCAWDLMRNLKSFS